MTKSTRKQGIYDIHELGDRQKVAFYERDDGFWVECEVP